MVREKGTISIEGYKLISRIQLFIFGKNHRIKMAKEEKYIIVKKLFHPLQKIAKDGILSISIL